MIELYNWDQSSQPNIFHFQGQSRYHYAPLFKEISEQQLQPDERLNILTVATDESMSPLISQLRSSHIPYKNLWDGSYYSNWTNIKKIELIINQLEKMKEYDVVLMMDGYDTAVRSFDYLYDRFLEIPFRVVFNSTKHNWPNIRIDKYKDRDFVGDFCYFNAGMVIGYVDTMKSFYKSCLKYVGLENPWDSEQFIVRHAWAEQSSIDERQIDFDHHCWMFQTMGSTQLVKLEENKYKII